VNSGRRAELARVLTSLRYLRYRNYEVIVVSDVTAADRPDCAVPVRWIAFAERNISAARNRGLAAARGEVIAFCDDDAVPEFGWLDALVTPFANPDVGSAGGFTRGRNGVSFQWRAVTVDRTGRDRRMKHGDETTVHVPKAGRFVKTVGTNCAFRREALVAIGGFDEAFVFFLDETDVNLRLSDAGWSTAVVPQAEVHHGFAASELRTAARVPKTLYEIGASLGYFLARHAPSSKHAARLENFRHEQRQRLDRHFLLGQLDARGMRALLAELEEGFADGAAREPKSAEFPVAPEAFEPVPYAGTGQRRLFCGKPGSGQRKMDAAAEAAAAGDEVTLLCAELSHRPLSVQFMPQGYFRHRFGFFGKSVRSEQRQITSFGKRFQSEASRILSQRGPFLP